MILQGVHHRFFCQDLQPYGDVSDHQVDLGKPVQARKKFGHFPPAELPARSQLINEGNLEEDRDGSETRVHLGVRKQFGLMEGSGEDHQLSNAVDDGYDAKEESHHKSNAADHYPCSPSSFEVQLVPLGVNFQ